MGRCITKTAKGTRCRNAATNGLRRRCAVHGGKPFSTKVKHKCPNAYCCEGASRKGVKENP